MVKYHAPAALQQAGTIMVGESRSPNTPSEELFPYDLEYRRRIDNDMTDAAVQHIADRADDTFLGQRVAAVRWRQWRIYTMNTTLTDQNPDAWLAFELRGRKVREVPTFQSSSIADAIKDAGIGENTILVFVSDNGPTTTATVPEEIHPASAGPWRGELGDAWEGSARTVGMVRWPGTIEPNSAHDMVSIMDFLPTFANIIGVDLPADRPIDGVDQIDYLTGDRSPDRMSPRWRRSGRC